jgi:spermidine synthase
MEPIASLVPSQIATAMPPAAVDDLLEWSPARNLPGYLAQVVSKEFEIEQELDPDPRVRITDDHPYNEYFLLRRWGLF